MSLKHRAEYAAVAAATALSGSLPLAASQRALAAVARCYFERGGRRVGYALTNLRIAFPELSETRRRAIGRESYVHSAWNVLDWLRSTHWSESEISDRFEVSGLERLRAALAQGRGALAVTLHTGNFELFAKVAPVWGVPVSHVGRTMSNRRLYERVLHERTRTGAEVIDRRSAAPAILRALRRGHVVVLLIDQYARRNQSVFAPLFGKRCSTTAGAATLALRTGAPVVPLYSVRVGPDRHRAHILDPIEVPASGDRRRDIERATAAYNAALERVIREYPEQWMWAHRRFRHSPDLDGPVYG
ncbi:MAG: lysophospholipid acyltransferase family protein [Proteobacteria bacterium]|nr:lysophospholipid acyltransferase family protein [Pseudomonadota bacterium]